MSLEIGEKNANTGMTKAIYDAMCQELEVDLIRKGLDEDSIAPIRESWKTLAFAIATGVINHVTSNMEIVGITVKGTIPGIEDEVTFTQSDDNVGRVRQNPWP